ncbi:4Fe-4S binding domain-containing protein [Pseudonocardia thermophila]|uniref:Ferredoxin n=1 Tax=Pseudonocardia thermophila TaxID=1848 RepID=A0A1M6Y213_PSETH|nr:4Fe-4S binding protein [Pseudonocardia thermophila]SHL12149.1 4Fe-4S binding domain-containing protein [Pseudonocardia thermophila]
MTYVITDACVDRTDRTCLDHCPVDCIRPGERMLYIDPDACIDCGACEQVCPQDAIFFAAELPQDRQVFLQVNAEFHEGVRQRGDHPHVAALPRRN